MDGYNAQLAASGRCEWVSSCLLRVDAASVTKKSDKSALMLVESRITKLRDL